MGAKAIDLKLESLEGAGGYAREMTEDRAQRQMEALAPYVANADALITTAAVPGRTAPLLVTAEMVAQMKPGSVVVDLAAESGGNVEGSVAGKVVRIGHAQVWGGDNVPSQMPGPASKLYAQNLVSLLTLMTSEGAFAPDFDDEVVAGAAVTHGGRIVHEPTREAIEGPVAAEPVASPGFETVADAPSSTNVDQTSPDVRDEQLDLPFDQEDEQ
jgi:NAD(P) transhydrogenase subunit alpha